MDEPTTRSIGGPTSDAWQHKVRELVYDYAISGKEFTAYDISDKLGLAAEQRATVGSILLSAATSGLIERTGEKAGKVITDPKEWLATGHGAKKRSVTVYRGVARMRRQEDASGR
jgi:hypothetical protein